MPSFYDLLKYAATGIASPGMTAYDKMRALAMAGGKVKTLTGVPPLSFRANGKPLISWSMLGNSQQNGTPAPDAAIMPDFVGERTKNLLDNQMLAEVSRRGVTYTKNADGSVKMFGTASPSVSFCILMGDGAATDRIEDFTTPIFKAGEQIIFSSGSTELLQIRFTDGTYGNYQDIEPYVPITVRKDIGLVYIQVNNGVTVNKTIHPMIRRADISGSTYEPYGWKIPVTSAGQTVPIYLGQVQTVRKIGKWVLTGEENWVYEPIYSRFYITVADFSSLGLRLTPFMSNAFGSVSDGRPLENVPNNSIYSGTQGNDIYKIFIKSTNYTTLEDWKAYLAAQYAAGQPVALWYILAEPKTAIVNEPLAKIGDYADELHSTDAGVTIPTAKGANTLTVDTELQPSSMTIKYR